MKRSNVKVGKFIEAKVTVLPYHIAGESYEVVEVEPSYYAGEYDCRIQTKGEEGQPFKKWVSSTDFREPRTKAPTAPKQPVAPVLTEECTTQNLQVGDTVLVGAEGAGRYAVRREYAGLTCTVTELNSDGTVEISHPHVMGGSSYTSDLKHLTKVVKEPVVEPEPVVQEFQEGDVLECITDCEGAHEEKCVAGRLYTYVCVSCHSGRICVGDPELYLEEAAVLPENFKLYARPVKDCTDADTPTA